MDLNISDSLSQRSTLHFSFNNKFIHNFIRNQQEFSRNTQNKYYIIQDHKVQNNFTLNAEVRIHTISKMKSILQSSKFCEHQHVIFHSLPTSFRKHLLRHVPDGVKITWIFYGYEYYHRREVIKGYLGSKTREYYNSWQNPNFAIIKIQYILDQFRSEQKEFKNDLKRIHQFAHWNPDEYEMIKIKYELTQMELVPFSMGLKIHEVVSDHNHRYLLLGHSGALTVNHLDGIDALNKDIIDQFDRVLIPFSYGSNKKYEAKVRKAAYDKIGRKAVILDHYIDRSSYFNLLSRVKAAWMPQMRGMGGGNILFCLKNNIPVILPAVSVMYQYFTINRFQIFAMERTSSSVPSLSEAQKRQNQKSLETYFGGESIRKQYHDLLSPF